MKPVFDRLVEIDASRLAPHVTWGTNPGMVVPVTGHVPDPDSFPDAGESSRLRLVRSNTWI